MPAPSLWRRLQTKLVIALASVSGGALAILAMNAVDSPRPEPRWTEADLPPVPHDNGWLAAVATGPLRPTRCPDRRRGSQQARLDHEADVAVDSVLRGERTPAEALVDLDVVASDAKMYRAACREAFAQPRFVDACRPGDSCRLFAIHHCHRAMLHEAVLAMAQDDAQQAVDLTADMLRARREHLATARSLVSHLIAAGNAGDLFALSALVAEEVPSSTGRLAALVRAYPGELPPPSYARVGEYLATARLIEDAAKGEWGPLASFFLDPGETLSMLDERSRADAPRPSDEIGWWVDNGVGDALIDMTLHHSEPDLDARAQKYASQRAAAVSSLAARGRTLRVAPRSEDVRRARRWQPHRPRPVDSGHAGHHPSPRVGRHRAHHPAPLAGGADRRGPGPRALLRDR